MSEATEKLVDLYDRVVDYLRISVTEACNFRCRYCMPHTPMDYRPKENLLSVDELMRFVSVALDHGVKKIRITGGEPTIRPDLAEIVRRVYAYKSDTEITLTTNGMLLKQLAQPLAEAGLQRINISLDSLDKKTFILITQKDALNAVLEGIDASLQAGLKIKINMVPMLGINDHEIVPMLDFCRSKRIRLRYIEYMENSIAGTTTRGLSGAEVLAAINAHYTTCESGQVSFGPAKLHVLEDGYKIGLIEPHKDDFCKQCNRIRLTADGKIVPCLYFDEALDAAPAIKTGDSKAVESVLKQAVFQKPEKNRWDYREEQEISLRAFYQTGG